MRVIEIPGKYRFIVYDSLSEFMEDTMKPTSRYPMPNASEYRRFLPQKQAPDWTGFPAPANCSDVAAICNKGWEDGAKRISTELEQLDPPPVQGIRRRPLWKDNGDHVDMDRVRSGNLDTAWWGITRRLGAQPPKVRIVADMCVNCGVNHSVVFSRGAAAVRLTEILTLAGYTVELWGAANTERRGHVGYAYTVKPFDAPFDNATASAGVALPATFRTLGIANIYKYAYEYWYGAGSAVPLNSEPLEEEGVRLFVVPETVTNTATANQWMKSCVKTLEVSYAVEREHA